MRAFVVVWAGQLVSQLGSALSAFAIAIAYYRSSGEIGHLSALAIAVYLPQVALAPYAGTLADRLDRRRLILAADAAAAVATLAMLVAARAGASLPVAVALVAAGSACNALQWPALESATVGLVPARDLARANGMLELSRGAAQLLAPMLGGILLTTIGLAGILAVDAASFAVALAATFAIRIPRAAPPPRDERDLRAAWRVIARQPGLVAMLALFAVTSFTFAVVDVALRPIVLADGEPWQLGAVLSTVGVGMLVGAGAMSTSPARGTAAILAFQLVEGGSLVLAGAAPGLAVLCAAAFAYGLVIPLTFGCARTLWQRAIPAGFQGRAAALRNTAATLAIPVGYAAATPLARVVALPVLVGAMGAVTWLAAVAAFAYRPYRELA